MQNCLMCYAYQAYKDARSSRLDKAFTIVRKWLEERKLEEVRTSELFDVWWD